jgi:pyruvate ferredoxin oxidoreductase alpha subunit
VLDPSVPRAFSELPEPKVYAALQRRVADAMDEARIFVDTVALDFSVRFGREKAGLLDVQGNLTADTALVSMGTIGDTALELLDDDDPPLLVRVHAYRPFPAEELAAVLANVAHVCVVDRAAAFGSLAPLGADVRSLDLPHAQTVTDVVCGVGGTEVTPDTLRWIAGTARAQTMGEPLYVPEGV